MKETFNRMTGTAKKSTDTKRKNSSKSDLTLQSTSNSSPGDLNIELDKEIEAKHYVTKASSVDRNKSSGHCYHKVQTDSRSPEGNSNSISRLGSFRVASSETSGQPGGESQTLASSLKESQSLIQSSANKVKNSLEAYGVNFTGETQARAAIMSKSTRLISAYFLAELMGTFLLVSIGDGAISAYVLTKQKIDLFTACFGFGVGAMIATFAAAKISGAHINPAATLAFALDGRLKWSLVPVYMAAQYLGGFLAALVLMLNNLDAISSLDGGHRSAFGSINSTGGIFATYPGSWVTPWVALTDQIVGTSILLFSLSAVSDKRNAGLEDRHQPLIVALVIGLVCVAFSPNCGAIFNPARDLAPRVVTALFGYPSVWEPTDGLYWLLAGVIGPHIGAILGLFAYKYLIGLPLKHKLELDADRTYEGDQSDPEHQARMSLSQRNQALKLHHSHDQVAETAYGPGSALRSH